MYNGHIGVAKIFGGALSGHWTEVVEKFLECTESVLALVQSDSHFFGKYLDLVVAVAVVQYNSYVCSKGTIKRGPPLAFDEFNHVVSGWPFIFGQSQKSRQSKNSITFRKIKNSPLLISSSIFRNDPASEKE